MCGFMLVKPHIQKKDPMKENTNEKVDTRGPQEAPLRSPGTPKDPQGPPGTTRDPPETPHDLQGTPQGPQGNPQRLQGSPRAPHEIPKGPPRGLSGPQRPQGTPQGSPRDTQGTPKDPQRAQRIPKELPRGSQRSQKRPKRGPNIKYEHYLQCFTNLKNTLKKQAKIDFRSTLGLQREPQRPQWILHRSLWAPKGCPKDAHGSPMHFPEPLGTPRDAQRSP